MRNYWKRLQNHPGVPLGIAMPLFALMAGLGREDGNWEVGVMGALVMGVFCWVPILITARTQPISAKGEEDK